jgi:HK97 family phage prohead protease
MDPLRKAFEASIQLQDGERALIGTITTGACDRDCEVIVPAGVNAKEYESNPVVLWCHDYTLPPVGKTVSLKRVGDALVAKMVFADRPADHPAGSEWPADAVWSLYKQGILRAFSIGFVPIEYRVPNTHDVEVYGPEVRRIFSKVKLLEISCVPVPANQEAVVQQVAKGLMMEQTARVLGFVLPDPMPLPSSVAFVIPPEKLTVAQRIKRGVRVAIAKARGKVYVDEPAATE